MSTAQSSMSSEETAFPRVDSRHDAVAAWFLGPRAENYEYFQNWVLEVLKGQQAAREAYFPQDQKFITPEMQSSSLFQENKKALDEWLMLLNKRLSKHSVPFWSPRYNGHMNMETSMPAILGYLTTQLYNPNNVALEASPLTTVLEVEVGKQLCGMLGYNIDEKIGTPAWGHITCDGSVANLEAIWAARNLKFYPLSLRMASEKDKELSFIRDTFKVTLCTGEEELLKDCSTWELLNLKPRTVVDLPTQLYATYGISKAYLEETMTKYLIQTLSKDFFEKEFDFKPPQLLVSTTKHYSWPKGAAIAGIGSGNVIDVPVDNAARMDPNALDKLLQSCLEHSQTVYAVVAIMGSTEQGACDPLKAIIQLRQKYEKLGLSFVVHCDAAWGGYFACMIPRGPKVGWKGAEDPSYVPVLTLQPYTSDQLEYFHEADSITIDPHKSGYVPYPAGGLCYRDNRTRFLVTWTSPVITHSDAENIGVYGVEGSKPGAAAVGAWLSHAIIGLNMDGYGALLGEAVFSCTKLYCHWATMSTDTSDLIVVPFNMLPAETTGSRDPAEIERQKKFIRTRILNKTNRELVDDKDAWKLLSELGSDLMINAFACNFRLNGKTNADVGEANYLNNRIFSRLSVQRIEDDVQSRPIILTSSTFEQAQYQGCLTNFKRRLGLKGDEDLSVLVNVTMSPFPTAGNFVKKIADAFQEIAQEELKACVTRNAVTPDLHGFVMQGTDQLYLVHLPMFHMANHRYQLIITGDVPPEVMQKYVKAKKAKPSQFFTLGNAEPDELPAMLKRGSFKAVIDEGLPHGETHFCENFELTNIRVVKERSLESRYLDKVSPTMMPFYLYGTLQQQHVDHLLLCSPNTQITSDCVGLKLERTLTGAELKEGVIAVFYTVHERVMQPFEDKVTAGFLPAPGKAYAVKIFQEGKDWENDTPLTKGTITMGATVYTDSMSVNMDPTTMADHGGFAKARADNKTHFQALQGPLGDRYRRQAIAKGWLDSWDISKTDSYT